MFHIKAYTCKQLQEIISNLGPTRSYTNRPVQPQKKARSLPLWMQVEEELYFPSRCGENKGVVTRLLIYTEQKKKRNNRPPRIFEFKGKALIISGLLLFDSHSWDIRVYHAKN